MDSLAGDAIVRFRAPGSILITRDYFRPPLSSLQGLLNRGVWKRQTCHVAFRDSIPVYRVGLRPLIRLPYSTPRVAISSDLHRSEKIDVPGTLRAEAQNAGGSLVQWQWQNPRCREGRGSISGGNKNNQRENRPPSPARPGAKPSPRIDRAEKKNPRGRGGL